MMSAKDIQPHPVGKKAWYYIGRTKLCYVQEERKPDGTLVHTNIVEIPWRVLKTIMAKVKP